MRKFKLIFLCALSALICLVSGGSVLKAYASSAAEIAMELTTGKILSESNSDARLPMASTTKIMTAIIVIEDCRLDEVITVPEAAVGVEGSSIYLKKDEEIDITDLLYGLMLRSGNDSAAALAIHHSGSIEKFVEVMNTRARLWGANNTNFKNPSGLPDDEHYTTARDLCEIARHAMQNQTFRNIVSTKSYKGKFRSYSNKNKMLYDFEGANGVKTGYTVKAGRCLVSSAERDGMDVICVVLNCPDMYVRSKTILSQCLDNFKLVKIDGDKVFVSDNVLCKPEKTQTFVADKNAELELKVVPLLKSERVAVGDLVAKLEIHCKNGLLFSENLYSIINR